MQRLRSADSRWDRCHDVYLLNTVKTHLKSIYRKLAASRSEVVCRAVPAPADLMLLVPSWLGLACRRSRLGFLDNLVGDRMCLRGTAQISELVSHDSGFGDGSQHADGRFAPL